MKIIFSRKGFDSSSGGVPNPILQDGTIFPLPIPDKQSIIKYEDIEWKGINVGALVSNLTNGKIKKNYFAHLDPDLSQELKIKHFPKTKNWKPIFGQTGIAQKHLLNNNINIGDIFIFFGLFREVRFHENKYKFVSRSMKKHIIWGWLQIEKIIKINSTPVGLEWAKYHPHLNRDDEVNNYIYIAKRNLSIPNLDIELPGGGIFPNLHSDLILTVSGAKNPSEWELPTWFYPKGGNIPITYHGNLSRWEKYNNKVRLKSVARGQEFILNTKIYPEATRWLTSIFKEMRLKMMY